MLQQIYVDETMSKIQVSVWVMTVSIAPPPPKKKGKLLMIKDTA
jgi:hypothetical protein